MWCCEMNVKLVTNFASEKKPRDQRLACIVALGLTIAIVGTLTVLTGCAIDPRSRIDDPVAELNAPNRAPRVHMTAMDMAASDPAKRKAYVEALRELIWKPGYTVEVREAAFDRLKDIDVDALKQEIRWRMGHISAWNWLKRLSALIANNNWKDLSPALVSSWARPTNYVQKETQRPEYQALAELHGEDKVVDVVFQMFRESKGVAGQGLRTRSWELLHRLGERRRLVDLLASSDVPDDDAMLIDLRAAARDLGIVPYNREEILWVRKLRTNEYEEFWQQAVDALAQLDADRKADLELRDVPVVVAAAQHRPNLLSRTKAELYSRLSTQLQGRRHYRHGSDYDNLGRSSDRLRNHRERLTWGDLLAMHLLTEALAVPEVVDHLFDYARRDRADETTEYGGVIRLDEKGRFEIVEFPPVIRHHDNKFIASQAMLDEAYTALFHFHLHVQNVRNTDYAGPGFGDVNYADNVRANCVVFTSVGENRLNVDYYRHGRVIVDLGVVENSM